MKRSSLLTLALLAILALSACNKSTPAADKKLTELERQNREVVEQKQQLEIQIADQQLASERDAIERERSRIDDERAALEQTHDSEAAAKQHALAAREQALAKREGSLELALQDKQLNLGEREQVLSGPELDAAGLEAIAEPEPAAPPAQGQSVADYGTIYDSLAAYGAWLETAAYGYVWQPAAVRSAGWRPYLDGRWVCTNHGWTWLSNEPFGWACYHYGRWALLHKRGWIWVPGDQWAPAWVCWRGNNTHIGWAPLPPETLGWRDCTWDSSVETRFGIATGWFNFVKINHFSSPLRHHCLPLALNDVCWQQTSNITHIRCDEHNVFVGGPAYRDISRSLGRPAPYYQLNLDQARHPGHDPLALRPQLSGHQLNMAAPAIQADWNAALRPNHVRAKLENAAIERPEPLAAGVVDHFRQHREQDQLQADQALTQLGGRQAFNQHRTQVLETNQRTAAAHEAPRQRPSEGIHQHQAAIALTPPEVPKRPSRSGLDATATRQPPQRPATGPQPKRPIEPRPIAPDTHASRQEPAVQKAEAARQQRAAQVVAQRQQAAEVTRQHQVESSDQQKGRASRSTAPAGSRGGPPTGRSRQPAENSPPLRPPAPPTAITPKRIPSN